MRHSIGAVRACLVGVVIAAASAPAFSQNLGLTVDLMAPNTACSGSKCPTDISLPNLGSSIASDSMVADGTTGASVVLNTAAATPIVCSEQRGPTTFGPLGTFVFKPSYSNASPGGLFEFDAGGASVVDATTVSLGGLGMAVLQTNTPSSQTACYPINALGVNSPLLADSSTAGDRVFYAQFEGGHRSDEPWVSINTVDSASDSFHKLGYVMQIHNASLAVNWHLSIGYDHAFFSDALNGGFKPKYCVLKAAPHAQPGPAGEDGETCFNASTTHVFTAGDIQANSNSIYVYVENFGSSAAVTNWATLPTSFFAASGAVFAPPGTYVQRVDDKVAVAGNVNIPTQNIGNIVCANDPLATACTITDSDGAGIPTSVTFKNLFTAAGAVALDPVAYVVDADSHTTLPSTTASLPAPSNVSCNDPNNILQGAVSFGTSTSTGARAMAFSFNPAGTLFVPGTATCSATFTANGISSTQSFNITMQQVNVTHFDVTADSTDTAGDTVNFTVTAKDGANHAVPTYTGTVGFTSSDPIAILPPNASLTLGTGSFTATLKKAGAQTLTATDTSSSTIKGTSNNVTVSAASAASLTVEILSHATHNVSTGLNVTPFDQYGNFVSDYTGTVHFTSTDGLAVLPDDGAFSSGVYNVTFNTGGTQTVTAADTNDGSITGTSDNVTVN